MKTPKEVEEELRAVLAKIEQESKARQAAEAEVARLRADLAKMQANLK